MEATHGEVEGQERDALLIPRARDGRVDAVAAYMVANGAAPAGLGANPSLLRLTHRFTPGLYTRECFIPAGTLVVTKIHKTEHPFAILQGHLSVYSEEGGAGYLEGPYLGVTQPGTQRVIFAHTDSVWVTFHPTLKTDPAEIEADIIEPYVSLTELAPVPALKIEERA
ncbi:MAG TPA: hypothetical protein VM285_01890 [Polyangia bacterium]|nr:hypothetical protein [Polyangia bacterium]